MRLRKFLGVLLVLVAIFVFVCCGDDEFVETPSNIKWNSAYVFIDGYGYDYQEQDTYTVYEGDSFSISFTGNGNYSNDCKFELHETTLGIVATDTSPFLEYEVDTEFSDLNAGETKEYEFWATGAGFTSEKTKVIIKDREPLILTDGNTFLEFPGKVTNNEYEYTFELVSHGKNDVKFTKDTKIKQFSRIKGEESFTYKEITGVYPDRENNESSYGNGCVEVTFDFPEENVNKEIELYYEYNGLKSNVITVKTLNYYFDIKVTDIKNHEVTEENPLVVYADKTQTLKFDISLFGPDGEIENFEYTFTDMFGNSEIKDRSVFSYELPDFNKYNEWYKDNGTDLTKGYSYDECRCNLRFKYSIESDEYSGDIYYLVDLGNNTNTRDKLSPVYYWYIPALETPRALFTGGSATWQKTDFSTTLTLKTDGSLNYGTFKNDCLDDNYDFEGTYVINPLDYTAKATVELDGEENTFEIKILEAYYDSNKGRSIYDTAFTMDLSSLGLTESEMFIKQLTTTPTMNAEYCDPYSNICSFTIDKNTMTYRFRQSDVTESLGTFTIDGNQITLDPLGDKPEFVGKKAIFSEKGVAIQYYDYGLEKDATIYLPKSSDANLELWINNENIECGFDWESNTALLNDHEVTIENKTDNGFDIVYVDDVVPCEKIEDDVFKFDTSFLEDGVLIYCVKAQFEDFDFNGTWVSSDGATLIIDDSKETEQLILTVGEYKISSTYFKHSGNIYSSGTDKTNFLSKGIVSASGNLYISYQGEDFATSGKLSNLILLKQQ